MAEKLATLPKSQEQKSGKLPIQSIPPWLMGYLVSWQVGQGLTHEGRKLVKQYVAKIMRGEKVSACYEVSLVYKDAAFGVNVEGEKYIPTKGPTLVIGNHTKAGPLAGMAQFFEITKVLAENRVNTPDVPFVVMQRGLTRNHPYIGGLINSLSGQLYELAAKSLDWELVSAPKYNDEANTSNGQIKNKQGLPRKAVIRLLRGGAGVLYPQGRNLPDGNLNFPNKVNGFLSRLRETDLRLLPLRVLKGSNGEANMYLGEAIPVREFEGINDFAQKHLAPLGINTRSYSIPGVI